MRRLSVRVKPGSRLSELIDQGDGTWLARIKAQPVDGKANEELRADRARIRIAQGAGVDSPRRVGPGENRRDRGVT
jgi:uncharacterized protein YggU (UPF0235/DUF167 family)